jgi:hypothetical protein
MKMMSNAMLALLGVFAASALYVAPALAEDNYGQSMQPSVDNMQNPNNNMPYNNMPNSSPTSGDMTTNNPSGADEITPDTATGDDDY